MKFNSNIELQAGLEDNNAASGTSGQVLSSTGTGVAWIDQNTVPTDYYTETESDSRFVNVAGDTMTGDLTLNNSGQGWIKGYDAYHSIKFRVGGTNKTEYYEYGGTLADGLGHKFFTGGTTGQTLKFQVADDGSYFSGNVGIGTTSPTDYKLDVVNTNDGTTGIGPFRVSVQANAGTVAVFENTVGINTSLKISDTVDDMYVVSRDGIMGLGASSGWSSNNLNIKSNGYVGIGNRNPSARLHVKGGTMRIDSGNGIDFYDGSALMGSINPFNTILNISSTYKIAFRTGSGQTEKMRLTDDGRLLLNTPDNASATNSRLEVIGTSTDSTTNLTFKTNGRLGIGNYNPIYKLDVNGSFRAGGLIANNVSGQLDFDGNPILYGNLSSGAVPASGALGVADSGIISEFPASEAIRIDSAGNVGIGTTSPSQKLHVNGNLRLTGEFYDSTNVSGSNGQVLTKVDGGTEWQDATGGGGGDTEFFIRYGNQTNNWYITGGTVYAYRDFGEPGFVNVSHIQRYFVEGDKVSLWGYLSAFANGSDISSIWIGGVNLPFTNNSNMSFFGDVRRLTAQGGSAGSTIQNPALFLNPNTSNMSIDRNIPIVGNNASYYSLPQPNTEALTVQNSSGISATAIIEYFISYIKQ